MTPYVPCPPGTLHVWQKLQVELPWLLWVCELEQFARLLSEEG